MSGPANTPICSIAAPIVDPSSCREDHFWRGVFNTLRFTVFQVAAMVGLSLLTAVVLNMKIRGRGFFRAVYFFPVLLSPVVVALIWKWILQRDGLLNAAITALGGDRILFLTESGWAMFWVDLRVGLGPYGLLHADPAGRPAGDSGGHLRGRRDGRDAALAGVLAPHPAAALAQSDRGDRAGADPRRADLRRGLRADRRRARARRP